MKAIINVNYDDLACSLIKLCYYYNSSVLCDDVLLIHLNSNSIQGFCLCLDSLGISYRFFGNDLYEGFYLDGYSFLVSD